MPAAVIASFGGIVILAFLILGVCLVAYAIWWFFVKEG
jgi:phage shock protein PspC (stress-responsive transcriptional regulator)